MKVELFVPFYIPGKYIFDKMRDDDGSEVDFVRWSPGANHEAGDQFEVIRKGKADGIHGIEDGIPVAICQRDVRPATDDMIGEVELVVIPLTLLKEVE